APVEPRQARLTPPRRRADAQTQDNGFALATARALRRTACATAREPPLAQHAGGHGGAAPRAGWRGWLRPRVRGAPPRAGVSTPQAVADTVRAWRVGLRLPAARCVPIRAGSAPRAPRWGTVPVPQPPPQVRWSAVRAAGAHASAAIDAWQHTRTGGLKRLAVSSPPQLRASSRACRRACAAPDGMRHEPLESLLAQHAGVTGVQRPVRGGGADPARRYGARSPARALGRHGLWLKRNRARGRTAPREHENATAVLESAASR
ncbi:MAG: hypothetical protein MI924_04930, partial [Chloroflexales bacterium]|nr:hypothetical protein [Chloroflexales bacterium]